MTGVYQKYSDYKNSEFEWLGDVPSHWVISKIKYSAPFQVGWTPPTKNDANFEGNNLWANISDLKGRYIENTAKKISDDAAKVASMEISPKGSLLYSFKLSVGAVSFACKDMYTNEAIASFLEGGELPLSFLYYALPKFVIENASTNIYGARILNQELINNALLLAPSYEEASAIANFLDHETTKIDTLIEKQQQLIKLLKEKRQAVISHVVTKGLSPNVPMRDSGVEWLGVVPEHWEIKRLDWITSEINDINHEMPTAVDDGVLFLSAKDLLNDGTLNFSDNVKKISEEDFSRLSKKVLPKKEDIIYSRIGAALGKARLVVVDFKFLVSYSCCVVRPDVNFIDPNYLCLVMDTDLILTEARLKTNGIGVPDLGLNEISRFTIPLPPIREQKKILEVINEKTRKLELLLDNSMVSVELMKERRTALISSAVTGKIDVRNWKNPESLNNKRNNKDVAV